MSQLIQLKQKIKSIDSTKKITHAIRLVSMSLYSKLEKQNLGFKDYKKEIKDLLIEIMPQLSEWKNNTLFPKDLLDSNPLIIVVSSSRGLCGSFNSNLFRYFQRFFLLEEHQNPSFITIGQKATKFISEHYTNKIIDSYQEVTSANLAYLTEEISKKIQNNNNQFSSVTFYSNFLKNFFVQKPMKSILIPISLEQDEENNGNQIEKKEKDIEFLWEQDKFEIADYLVEKYIKSSILNLLFQSFISEQASRFIAMDNSTTNAKKILEKLTLQYNKARQTLITREVAELSAGSEK